MNNLWEEIVFIPDIIPYNRVEAEREIPNLKLYENTRILIRRVSKARYSWEVVVFYVSITIS